uniref:Uncharacterized protein n=1 Tax=Micrurus lemniscatus lemniscatus TaxID=129467 RepID=A0A2D4J6P2_MICLE
MQDKKEWTELFLEQQVYITSSAGESVLAWESLMLLISCLLSLVCYFVLHLLQRMPAVFDITSFCFVIRDHDLWQPSSYSDFHSNVNVSTQLLPGIIRHRGGEREVE